VSHFRSGTDDDDDDDDLISLLILFLLFCYFFFFFLLFFLIRRPLQKRVLRLRRFKSDRGKISQDFPQVNTHPLTDSGFQFDVIISRWRPLRHFT